MSPAAILILIAVVLFAVAAFNSPARINLVAAGLAFFAASFLADMI